MEKIHGKRKKKRGHFQRSYQLREILVKLPDRQKQRKFPPISSNVNKSCNEPAAAKANLPAAIKDNKKKKTSGRTGEYWQKVSRKSWFIYSHQRKETKWRIDKGKELGGKSQTKNTNPASPTWWTNIRISCLEGMKAKFPLNVRAGLMIDHFPLIVKIFWIIV